jgi:drug/metabolite transporter (DMT)-like permease
MAVKVGSWSLSEWSTRSDVGALQRLLALTEGPLTTEDRGMAATSIAFVNMPEQFWIFACCIGVVVIALLLSRMQTQVAEDMSFFQALPIAVVWAALGISLIFFNKFIFLPSGTGFDFPFTIFLMWLHALTGTIATNIVRVAQPSLMPAVADKSLTAKTYVINIFPVAILQAAALGLGNMAYLHISVAYIQMVKNTTSAFVFMFSIMLGLETATVPTTFAVLLVVSGLWMTSAGELDFAWFGFLLQISATFADSLRLSLTKVLLSSQHAVKLDAMSALYYFSPTVLLILSTPMYFVDFQRLTLHKLFEMKFVLLANAILALSLNMTSMFFMKRCGATTYALTGVVKDIALIILCCVAFGHPMSSLQLKGFFVSLFGFQLYNKLKTDPTFVYNIVSSMNIGKRNALSEQSPLLEHQKSGKPAAATA